MKKLTYLAVLLFSVFACSKSEVDTDQFTRGKEVTLNVYGPRPVARGGELRFIGSNLDKVVSVEIPGISPVTDIKVVKAGVPSEIRIIVPKEGPEPGYLTLKTADGKSIVTTTPLSYEEPITIESISPEEVLPGGTLTITGDYLNLVKEVIFPQDQIVTEFESQSRYELVVKVPVTARSGQIGFGDADETTTDVIPNVVYSEVEVVVTTAEGALTKSTWKAGETVTIEGTNLDLVESITLMGGVSVETELEDDVLSFVLPAEVPDGEVLMVHASGVEVSAGELETVVPTVTSISPSPAIPGEELVLNGTDLDLVNSLEVPAASDANRWPGFNNDDVVTLDFTVPADALPKPLVLHMKNGKTVEVEYDLAVPSVTSLSATTVAAGETITVSGQYLNLVSGVTIGGADVSFEIVDAATITITTSATTLSGQLVLKTANGTEVAYEDEDITIDYGTKVTVSAITASAKPGESVTMTGAGFNYIESIYLDTFKVTAYTKREDTEMVFLMPDNIPAGVYTPVFHLTTGEEETPVGVTITYVEEPSGPQTVTIWEGSETIGNWGGSTVLAWDGYDWSTVAAGTTIRIHFTEDEADYHQLALRHGAGWGELAEKVFFELSDGQTYQDYVLTEANQADLVANGGLVMTGYMITITKVELIIPSSSGDAGETVIWEGSETIGNWGGSTVLAWDGYDWSTVAAGTTIRIYFTEDDADYHQLALRHGAGWGELAEKVFFELSDGQTYQDYVLTEANQADLASNGGLVMTGYMITITKVALL